MDCAILGQIAAGDAMTNALTRAKRYPFARPEYSFVFAAGRAVEIVETGSDPLADCNVRLGGRVMAAVEALDELGVADAAALGERTAVLGYGSNATPEQLARKFHDTLGETVIPVLRARLADHDVVYSAHFARYGSIAATLAVSPGTTVDVAVLYLGPAELARIHDTELGVYDFGTLDDARLTMRDTALPPAPLEVYLSRHGGVARNGGPLALAEIAAEGRGFSASGARAGIRAGPRPPGAGSGARFLPRHGDRRPRRARTIYRCPTRLRRSLAPPPVRPPDFLICTVNPAIVLGD